MDRTSSAVLILGSEKPFNLMEITDYLRKKGISVQVENSKIRNGITLLPDRIIDDVDNTEIIVNSAHLKVFKLLLEASPRVLTRDFIVEAYSEKDGGVLDRTVDVHIVRLRKALPERLSSRILTVRGVGYKFE